MPPLASSDNRAELSKLNLSIDELTRLAPRLQPYLQTARPGWPDIINAADWLRGELGVSRPLWDEACAAMGGRISAAIAIAVVSAKPADHFRTSPGGYFHGMVVKAKNGELNLVRTIWGLRTGPTRRGKTALDTRLAPPGEWTSD